MSCPLSHSFLRGRVSSSRFWMTVFGTKALFSKSFCSASMDSWHTSISFALLELAMVGFVEVLVTGDNYTPGNFCNFAVVLFLLVSLYRCMICDFSVAYIW